MKQKLDTHYADVACPYCGHKSSGPIGRLRRDPTMTCPVCRKSFAVTAESLEQGAESAQKALDDFVHSVGRTRGR